MPKIFLLLDYPFLSLFDCREQAFVEDFLGSVPIGNSRLDVHVEPCLEYIEAIMKPWGRATLLFLWESAFFLPFRISSGCLLFYIHSFFILREKSLEEWSYLILTGTGSLIISGMCKRGQESSKRPMVPFGIAGNLKVLS